MSNVDKSDIFQHWNDHDINYPAKDQMDDRDDDGGEEGNFQLPNEYHINYGGDDESDVTNDDEDVIDHEYEEAGNQNIPPEDYLPDFGLPEQTNESDYDGDDELDVFSDDEDIIDHKFEEPGNQNILSEDYLPIFDLPEQIDDTDYNGDDEVDVFSDDEDVNYHEFEEAGNQNILPEDDLPIFALSEQIDYALQNQVSNIVNNISLDQTLIENDSAYAENVEVQCMEKVNILKIFSPV